MVEGPGRAAALALLALACTPKASPVRETGAGAQPPRTAATLPPPAVGAAAGGDIDADILTLGDADSAREKGAVVRIEARGATAVPPLLRELDRDRLGGVGRARILTLLSRIGAPEGLPPALAALDDRLAGVRAAAIDAVSAFRDPRATAALIRRLDAADADVVIQAALRLGERGDPAAVPRLGALLGSPAQGIRYSAALALSRIATPPARALLRRHLDAETDAEVRAVIAAGLEKRLD
jgi:HEAT repeat protein